VKNIFVWHQGALGDVLLAGPALQAVAAQYSGANLTLVGGTEQLNLLADTLPVAAVWSGHQGRWLELFQESWEISSRLRELLSQFELALVLTPIAKPEFLQRLKQAGIPLVVWLPSFPVQDRISVRKLHAGILEAAGLKNPLRPFRLCLPESGQSRRDDQGRGEFRVVMAPGSGNPRKNWPLDNYLELARRLEECYGARTWWVLGPAESGWQRDLPEKIPPLRMLRDLPLRQLAADLREFHLYVGNDSGVTHLAAALGGPAVTAIFGPSDPLIWAPQGERTVLVTPDQPCAPCTRGREITCNDPVCLTNLTPEKVLTAIRRARAIADPSR
jgi:ADP-heptose:LPS heptosyltransferase